jgi:hypothetical protein
MAYSNAQNKETLAVVLLWAARILGSVSILFLLFMILGHIFGQEPQHFNGFSDVIALAFFPGGLLLGLVVALKSEKIGGTMAFLSMCVFFLLRPDTITSFWIVVLFIPSVLFFVYGWWLQPKSGS